MENRNETFCWWQKEKKNKIIIAPEILDWNNPIRGIYGIFIKEGTKEYCAYVGRSTNIYQRFFSSGGKKENRGHLVRIKDGDIDNEKIKQALENECEIIEIKLLEEVKCQYDNYYKDMQRLAFAEYYYISKYQELDQCLEQLPDGSNMKKQEWENIARKKID